MASTAVLSALRASLMPAGLPAPLAMHGGCNTGMHHTTLTVQASHPAHGPMLSAQLPVAPGLPDPSSSMVLSIGDPHSAHSMHGSMTVQGIIPPLQLSAPGSSSFQQTGVSSPQAMSYGVGSPGMQTMQQGMPSAYTQQQQNSMGPSQATSYPPGSTGAAMQQSGYHQSTLQQQPTASSPRAGSYLQGSNTMSNFSSQQQQQQTLTQQPLQQPSYLEPPQAQSGYMPSSDANQGTGPYMASFPTQVPTQQGATNAGSNTLPFTSTATMSSLHPQQLQFSSQGPASSGQQQQSFRPGWGTYAGPNMLYYGGEIPSGIPATSIPPASFAPSASSWVYDTTTGQCVTAGGGDEEALRAAGHEVVSLQEACMRAVVRLQATVNVMLLARRTQLVQQVWACTCTHAPVPW